MNYYFAYGSNMNLNGMNGRCPDATPIRKHRLFGWRLVFRGVADIERAQPTDYVDGCIYQITRACEKSLDRYEGFPHSYVKGTFRARNVDGRRRRVMFYVMPTNRRWTRSTEAQPTQGYFDCIARGFFDWSIEDASTLDAALDSAVAVEKAEREEQRNWMRSDGSLSSSSLCNLTDVFGDDFVEDEDLLDAIDARQIPLDFTKRRKAATS